MPRASWSGFSAPVSGVLPGLSLAGDDAHKIPSFAPGVATSCGRRGRPGGAGSGSGRVGCRRIKTAASRSARDRASGSSHPDRAASTRPEDRGGNREVGSRQRIRIRPRPVRYIQRGETHARHAAAPVSVDLSCVLVPAAPSAGNGRRPARVLASRRIADCGPHALAGSAMR